MLNFEVLWRNFPEKKNLQGKCRNAQDTSSAPFDNYCAILLSEALIKCGVSTAGSNATKCWSHQGMKHILLAEQLAEWLNKSNIGGLGSVEKISPASF